MKLYTSLFLVVACLFALVGCAQPPSRQATVVEAIPPVVKTLTLEVGKTSRDSVTAAIGQPKKVVTGSSDRSTWYYDFNRQNVILDASIIGKDGYTNKAQWDLRTGRKRFRLHFEKDTLNEVSM